MKYIFFVFVMLIPFVSGVAFSPDMTTFLSKQAEELCHVIKIEFESGDKNIKLFDVWAENESVEREIDKYDVEASFHGLTIDYDKEATSVANEIEICVIGTKVGKFNGAVVSEEHLETIWLEVVVEEKESLNNPSTVSDNPGGGSKKNKLFVDKFNDIIEEEIEMEIEELSKEFDEEIEEPLGFIEESGDERGHEILWGDLKIERITFWNYVPIAFIIFVLGAKIYVTRKHRRTLIKKSGKT